MKIENGISKFNLGLKILKASEEAKSYFRKSYASSDYLKKLLPEIDEKKNPDLLAISFNSAVVNLINANDDGMLTPEAKIVTPTFQYKPINVEHYRYAPIGSILNYGFSDFGSEQEMTEIADDFTGPFNIALGGFLWKSVDEWMVERVEECANENDRYCYQDLSASWEIGFSEFVIALGSKKIADAEIVEEDAKVKELMKYLRAEGGPGFMDDGTPVYRIIKGQPIALGVGITGTPAAQVKGIITASERLKAIQENISPEEFKKVIASIHQNQDSINKILENLEKTNKLISTSTKNSVNTNRMKIKDIEDISDEILKEAKASASDVKLFLREKLDEANEKFIKERDAQKTTLELVENEAKAAKAEVATLKEQGTSLQNQIVEITSELTALKNEKEAVAKKSLFDSRLSEVKESYNLDEKIEKIVASQIENLDEDGFKAWKDNFALLGASFKKGTKEAVASTLKGAKTETPKIPNASEGGEELSFTEKAKIAFFGAKKESK